MRSGRHRRVTVRVSNDRGSASIWVVGCIVLVLFMTYVVGVRAAASTARHRAETAADFAALAGAGRIGVGSDPCTAARAVAEANGASVSQCETELAVDGRSGTIRVEVTERVQLPLVGSYDAGARARAERAAVP